MPKGLEMKVEERTIDLHKSNELKGMFIDIMRHDLLNPVTVIKGFAELLNRDKKFRENKKFRHNSF